MFENLDSPQDLFLFRLGTALSMEKDSRQMLEYLVSQAKSVRLKELLQRHSAETLQQISNLERCFAILEHKVHDSPSPTTAGLSKEGKSLLRKTSPELSDSVVVSAALETEHYEIAVYEGLLSYAEANGHEEVAALFSANLEQERAAAEALRLASERLALRSAGKE